MEGPTPRRRIKYPPYVKTLETIREEDMRSEPLEDRVVPDTEDKLEDPKLEIPPLEYEEPTIDALDPELATELWDEVRKKLLNREELTPPPMSYVAPSHENSLNDLDMPDPSNWEHLNEASSDANTLRTLPDYLGEYEAR